jgi:hypothetical protein
MVHGHAANCGKSLTVVRTCVMPMLVPSVGGSAVANGSEPLHKRSIPQIVVVATFEPQTGLPISSLDTSSLPATL